MILRKKQSTAECHLATAVQALAAISNGHPEPDQVASLALVKMARDELAYRHGEKTLDRDLAASEIRAALSGP